MSASIACALLLSCVVLTCPRESRADDAPTAAMMEPVAALVRFMASLPPGEHATMFATHGVTIIENFAPFIFSGKGAVAGWEAGVRGHFAHDGLTELRTEFGAAQDFAVAGDRAYFVLPTTWTGRTGGKRFEEHGAWSFVLARTAHGWKVLGYGWGVTGYHEDAA